jgi:anti-sigma B factor antagonist
MLGGEPSDRLRLGYRTDHGVAIVDVDGQIDVFTRGMLRDRLLTPVNDGHSSLVVNLGRAGFVDSTGLGVLVGVWRRLRPVGGVLALAAPTGQVRAVLGTPRFDQVSVGLPEHG